MENQQMLLACRLGLAMVAIATLYWKWMTIALLLAVVVAVWATDRYLTSRYATILPPHGKTVLITGCDTGIGHETAVAAAEAGLTVIACCYDANSPGAKRLRGEKYGARVHVMQLDVTNDDSVERVRSDVTELCSGQGLWAVVNNAGLNRQAPVELTSMASFQLLADVMLFGTVRVTKALLPVVRQAKGRVITMSSDRGMLSPANSAAYCISKHGVETFSDVLRAEMYDFGVSVSVIQPGHFGGATAIINDKAIDSMRASLEADFESSSKDAQRVYGREKIDQIVNTAAASRQSSPKEVTPIVHAIVDALLNKHPATRYPVHGQLGLVDWGIVLGQVKPVLPDRLVDWVQRIVMGNK